MLRLFFSLATLCAVNFAGVPGDSNENNSPSGDSYETDGFYSSTWPSGVVPYEIDDSIDSFMKERILNTIKSMNEKVLVDCVTFRPKTDDDRYFLTFQASSDGKCRSRWIGFARMPGQPIYLTANCSAPRFIFYALLQALGLPNEHQRPNRDSYVSVNWDNIADDSKEAFKRFTFIDPRLDSLPYDLFSRLHYPGDRFAKEPGLTTMVAVKSASLELGNLMAPTSMDYEKLAALYCVSNRTTTTTTTTGEPPVITASVSVVMGDSWTTVTTEVETETPPNPIGVQALAPNFGLNRAMKTNNCLCFDRTPSRNSCDDRYSFQWKGMSEHCLGNTTNNYPLCNCESISLNPCWCKPVNGACVKRCARAH